MTHIRWVGLGTRREQSQLLGFIENKSQVQSMASAEPGVLRNAGGDHAARALGPEVP